MASTPILPLALWQSGTNQNSIPANDNALRIEALNREIISQAVTAQPASPADGDTYIIATTHTGAQWAGFTPKDIAIFNGGTWYAWAPTEGLIVNVAGDQFKFDGGSWVAAGGGGGGAVSSVNSQTGAVVLDTDDIGEGITNLYLTPERVQDIVGALVVAGANMTITYDDVSNTLTFAAAGGGGGGAVTSVNGQTGAVSLALDDLSDVTAASPTTGYFLSWNGTAWVPAAGGGGGGGGLTNWTESVDTAAPNATKPVVAFTATNPGTDVDVAIVPKGNGAVLAAVPDGTTAGGVKRGQNAVDLQTDRFTNTQVASGGSSVIAGGRRNTASGSTAFVGGGFGNVASGTSSVVAGGDDNTASGGQYPTVGGGQFNTAGGDHSTVPGGFVCNASGLAAFAMGYRLTADGAYSGAVGRSGTTRGVKAAMVHANGNYLSGSGDAQVRRFVFVKKTPDATPSVLLSDGSSAGSANSVVLEDGSTYTFTAYIAAHKTSNNDSAGWRVEGVAKRGTSGAASTMLVGAPTVTSLGADAGASGWTVAAVANTSLGSLDIQVTGAVATTINWVARIETVEVVG